MNQTNQPRSPLVIHAARPGDVPVILGMIQELAEFEQLAHMVVADAPLLHEALFGPRPACECVIGSEDGKPVTFALFFHNFSTFLGRRGLYLEDLYVQPAARRRGHAKAMLAHLAALAVERGCGRFEWSVLDWNVNAIGFYEGLGATVMPEWRICRLTGPGLQALATSRA
ncbi:MAG: GNAT family N-acetyltransferase [Herminiimonas sp.]|nr:GNAT family N-acetyltransferase [Herminiimonas sp.]